MALHVAKREAAFMAFNDEFSRNGYGKAPEGLVRILADFQLKPGETACEGRARIYKRLWCLLWFGSGKKLGAEVKETGPTYVYPTTLKAIIREIIPEGLVDQPDPTHAGVYKVNIGDLHHAKWPAAKKRK